MKLSLALLSSFFSFAAADDLALYWGQASAGSQKSLSEYCQSGAGDIYIISFITTFGSGRQIAMNVAGYNNFISGTQLLDAPELGQEIQTCQGLGKKVLISMGGASGSYGFDSESDAESVATELWNYFGGGTSSTRPFGDAKIDGFDLDGENNLNAQYYVPFVNKLRELYATDASKQYYVSAAPQCPYPDATTGQAVAQADLDFVFIQFYNNYCSLSGNNFNYDTWQSWATSSAPNKNVKLFVGLAGSPSAAGSGYVTIDEIKQKKSEFANGANFGGFMVWDASQANQNIVNGETFAQQLKELDGGSAQAPASTSSSSTPVAPASTSTPAAPVASSTSESPVNPGVPTANNWGASQSLTLSTSNTAPYGGNATVTDVHTMTTSESCTTSSTPATPVENQKESTSTQHSTSTLNSVIAQTSTITSAPAAAPKITSAAAPQESCYTSNGEVVVVETEWATQYTTLWV